MSMAKNNPDEKKSLGARFVGGLKEAWRKFLVAIKRRPQMIPLVALVITFLVYSLNLMHISDTTAKIQGSGMGLAGFATMLFSMLSMVCCMNAFPYRKKTNIPMLVLMFVMLDVIIFADVYYLNCIYAAISRPDNPIVVTVATAYIAYAEWYIRLHLIMIGVSIALVVLLPVYSKLIRKIKTSVDVQDNGSMDAIDISGDA